MRNLTSLERSVTDAQLDHIEDLFDTFTPLRVSAAISQASRSMPAKAVKRSRVGDGQV